MIIVLMGASGSGKSTIESILSSVYGYKRIISYTTRSPRNNEKNGEDYFFTNNQTFEDMVNSGLFIEYDEYSQNRKYGTLFSDYVDKNRVVVLTPNGFRKIKDTYTSDYIFSVLIDTNIGTRIKRYIDRCGVDRFNYDDKNEIASRVERDFGMFLGLEKEVDLVVHNNENADVNNIVRKIINGVNNKEKLIEK